MRGRLWNLLIQLSKFSLVPIYFFILLIENGRKVPQRNYQIIKEVQFSYQAVAIVAYYPRMGSDTSNLRLLENLKKHGFSILVVENRSELRSAHCVNVADVWIERENSDFDFGAYAVGLDYLERCHKGKFAKDFGLLFINTSCYFTPRFVDKLLPQIVQEKGTFALIKSQQYLNHLQTWFFQLSNKALNSARVRKFILRGFGVGSKQQLINREVSLSVILAFSEGKNYLGFFPNLDHDEMQSVSYLPKCAEGIQAKESRRQAIRKCIQNHNPSHHFAREIAYRGFPIKMDLWRLYSESEIAEICSLGGLSNLEIASAIVSFRPQHYQHGPKERSLLDE